MFSDWFVKCLISVLLVTPAWLAIGFFDKNYKVRSDVFLVWYMLGIIITCSIFGGSSLEDFLPSWKLVSVMLLIGLTFGAIANMLCFRAIVSAPNPGLPIAIINTASILVFFSSALLGWWLPEYFKPVKIDPWQLLGAVLSIAGVSIIALRR